MTETEEKAETNKSIRGLDPDLYRRARAEAVSHGKRFGEWLNEAIRI